MTDDLIDELILQSIPPKKYRNEWDSELLKDKVKDVKTDNESKTIQELDREKLEKKFSKEDKEKLN